jgi:hypothetical protein
MTRPIRLRATSPHELPAPRIDHDSAAVLTEAIDALAAIRTPYWLGDSGVHLHALTSLQAHAQPLLPDAVARARDQGLTWQEIGQLLGITAATAARRYRNGR